MIATITGYTSPTSLTVGTSQTVAAGTDFVINYWTQQGAPLVGSGGTGTDEQGYSVSLSANGNTLAVGGPDYDSDEGAIWIFTQTKGI